MAREGKRLTGASDRFLQLMRGSSLLEKCVGMLDLPDLAAMTWTLAFGLHGRQ